MTSTSKLVHKTKYSVINSRPNSIIHKTISRDMLIMFEVVQTIESLVDLRRFGLRTVARAE